MVKPHLVLPTESPATFSSFSLGTSPLCWAVPALTLQQTHNGTMFNLSVRVLSGAIESQPGANSLVLAEVILIWYIGRALLLLAAIGGLMSAYFMSREMSVH